MVLSLINKVKVVFPNYPYEPNSNLTVRYNHETDVFQVLSNGEWKDTILRGGLKVSELSGVCTHQSDNITNTFEGFIAPPIYVALTCVETPSYFILYDAEYSKEVMRYSYDGGSTFTGERKLGTGDSAGDWLLSLTNVGASFIDKNGRHYNYIARGYKL